MSEPNREKPWLKQPGECHDQRGFPIYPGDLLRSPHFKDRRGRNHYLYHVAVCEDGAMWMVPTSHLEKTAVAGGGRCLLSDDHAAACRIINGHGPGDCLDFEDRERKARPTS